MSHACTPILVGVASTFSEILLLSKAAKFPFQTVDSIAWVSKNLIIRNWLKKFMQIGIDVTCMHTNFGWRDVPSFEDIATFKSGQISLLDRGLYSMGVKKFNDLELAQKFYASRD